MLNSILSVSKRFPRPQTVFVKQKFCQSTQDNKHKVQKLPVNYESKLLNVLNGIDNWDACR